MFFVSKLNRIPLRIPEIRLGIFLIAFLFILSATLSTASNRALAQISSEQREAFNNFVLYYDVGGYGNCSPSTVTTPNPLRSGEQRTLNGESGFTVLNPAPFTGAEIEPKGIVLHWTGGPSNATPEDLAAFMSNSNVSVQLYVDGSGTTYQLVEKLNTLTAHAKEANDNTIGIEIGGGSDGSVETAEKELLENTVQKQAVTRTVAYLQQKYNIPTEGNAQNFTGLLSHHQLNEDKSDVGDQYLEDIKAGLQNDSQQSPTTNSCTQGGGGGGSPEANKILGQEMAAAIGFTGEEWPCLLELWTRESQWNHNEKDPDSNNPTSSAYGIPQALMGVHKSVIDRDYPDYYETEIQNTPGNEATYDYTGGNPRTQISWGLEYIKGRYQTPCRALDFHTGNNYY